MGFLGVGMLEGQKIAKSSSFIMTFHEYFAMQSPFQASSIAVIQRELPKDGERFTLVATFLTGLILGVAWEKGKAGGRGWNGGKCVSLPRDAWDLADL